jgi:hypothetical protein
VCVAKAKTFFHQPSKFAVLRQDEGHVDDGIIQYTSTKCSWEDMNMARFDLSVVVEHMNQDFTNILYRGCIAL